MCRTKSNPRLEAARTQVLGAQGLGVLVLAVCSVLATSTAARGQGLLISSEPDQRHRLPRPITRPPNQPGFLYDVSKLEIDASIRDQVAQVQVGQTFKNRTSRVLQVKFVFPLPYDGAVDQMTFMVDGEELEGRLLEADKAREIYQSYVRRSQDPALVQWIGTGMFQTQVFPVPPGAERTVSLRYTQLCRRSGALTDWLLPLSPTRFTCAPIGEIAIRGRIRNDSKIGNIYSPSHEVQIDRISDHQIRFEYLATARVPKRDFRLLWDSGDRPVQLSVVSHRANPNEDGYFMLMIQPQLPEPPRDFTRAGKNIVFVMDKSGSMRGEKIDQARRAANDVIDRLKNRDRFTLINYDSRVETFRNELVKADKETRSDAKDYVDAMLAGGSTNIDEALSQAFKLTEAADGPVYVVFVTDGCPTVGERNAMKIAANAKANLREGTRLFSLGLGHDVNSRLLDKLASICLGQTNYIRPGEPLDRAVSALYDRIKAPALVNANLKLTVDGKQGRVRQLYPADMYDLFSGDQLVIVGRYRKPGVLKIHLSGEFLGEQKQYRFEDELPAETGSGENVFVERLWATRRIGQIIDEIDLHGENQELTDELIVLSKRHGILTPYTAYLAEEQTDLNNLRSGRRVTSGQLELLDEESGRSAFRQRELKSRFKLADRAAEAGANFGAATESAPAANGITPIVGDFAVALQAAKNEERAPTQQSVRRIGAKTFYRRGERYVDAAATKNQLEAPHQVERFSDEYFKLLEQLGSESKLYLAEDSDLLVILKGKAYLFVSPTPQSK